MTNAETGESELDTAREQARVSAFWMHAAQVVVRDDEGHIHCMSRRQWDLSGYEGWEVLEEYDRDGEQRY